MNRNYNIGYLYEDALLQSLKAGYVYLCLKCKNYKSITEFSKNQKWCRSCNIEKVVCGCGKIMHLKFHKKHLSSKFHL